MLKDASFDLVYTGGHMSVWISDITRYYAESVRILKPGGRFVFTLERMETPLADNVGYRLNEHGRYTHSQDYVAGCLPRCGLRLLRSKSVDLREQAGQPVGGLLVTAARA